MTSTLLKMLCDIKFTLSWSEILTVCHMIFGPICDVLAAVQQNVDFLSQQSWMKNTWTKCCWLWDKIWQWVGLSHCDKPSKFTRSLCHNLGWTDNPSTLRRNVTVVNCHSRRFVSWTLCLGRIVAWSVYGWTDGQGTIIPHLQAQLLICAGTSQWMENR